MNEISELKKKVKYLENQNLVKTETGKFDPFNMSPLRPSDKTLTLEMSDYYDLKMSENFKSMVPKTH
jgi:hypothetical protein